MATCPPSRTDRRQQPEEEWIRTHPLSRRVKAVAVALTLVAAGAGVGTPAVGHVHAKTGTRAAVELAGVGLIGARPMVGYIDAASGRPLVFSIMVGNVPFDPVNFDGVLQVIADAANISVAMYEAY